MRAFVLSAVLLMLNLALNISMAKGWADWIPNWVVALLWVVPIVPLVWWLWTHDWAVGQREWLKGKFRTSPGKAYSISVAVSFVVLLSILGASYQVRAAINRKRQATTDTKQTASTAAASATATQSPPVPANSNQSQGSAKPNNGSGSKKNKEQSTAGQSSKSTGIVTEPPPATSTNTSPSQVCPNGVCIGGDNNGSATVNNYGETQYPPAGTVPTTTVCVQPSKAVDPNSGHSYETLLTIESDTRITRPEYIFYLDAPVLSNSTVDAPVMFHANQGGRDPSYSDPEKTFRVYFMEIGSLSETSWYPNTLLSITFFSNDPVHLLNILGGSGEASDINKVNYLAQNYSSKCP